MNIFNESAWIEPGDDEAGQGDEGAAAAASTAQAAAGEADSPFRKGVELAGNAVDAEEVAPLQPVRETDATGPVDDGASDDDAGKTEEEIAAAAKAKGDKPAEQAAPEGDDEADAAQKAFDEKLASEAEQLRRDGVQPKAIERFKAQANRIRELEVKVTETETRVPELERLAGEAIRWEESIASTGSTPDQFGRVMGYLYAINKGTVEQKQQARQALHDELAWIDSQLGVKSEHFDPLDEFPDLKAKVESAALDEEDALEMARLRRIELGKKAEETQETEAQARERAQEAGLADLKKLGAELAKNDTQFAARLKLLQPTIAVIYEKYEPKDWAAQTRKAYEVLKKAQPVIAEPKPRVTPPVLRPGPGGGDQHQNVTSANAFRTGVEAQRKTGR